MGRGVGRTAALMLRPVQHRGGFLPAGAGSSGKDGPMKLAPTRDVPAGPESRGTVAVVLFGPVAVLISLAGALFDDVTVADRSGLAQVTFGFPFGWLTQDQSSLDPSLPSNVTPLSPWDYPVGAAVLPLVADVLVIYVGLLLVVVASRAVGRFLSR